MSTAAASADVPTSGKGCQEPRTGNNYAGIISQTGSGSESYAEYIQQALSEPLIADNVYTVEFWASLADTSRYAVDGLGAHFSSSKITRSDTQPFSVVPQIRNPGGNFLSDKNNWMQIRGKYKAVGGEQWITIGTFETARQDTPQNEDCMPHNNATPPTYFIDDVSVSCPNAVPAMTIQRNACAGDIVTVDGSESTKVDNYWVFVWPTDKFGSDVVLAGPTCIEGPFAGPVSSNIDLEGLCPGVTTTPGIYRIELQVAGGCNVESVIDWVSIQPVQCCGMDVEVTPPGPVALCGPVTLDSVVSGGQSPYQYFWTRTIDNASPLFAGLTAGIGADETQPAEYQVTVTDAASCKVTSEPVAVSIATNKSEFTLPGTICENDSLWLDATGSVGDSYTIDVYKTDYVASQADVGSHWTVTMPGTPGLINLTGSASSVTTYPFPLERGAVYRVELAMDGCSANDQNAKYVVVKCCDKCAQPPTDMVGWWDADGTANDLSGYASHGTISGTVPFDTGKVGEAFLMVHVDSTTEYWQGGHIEIPASPSMNLGAAIGGQSGSGDFSIDAWIQVLDDGIPADLLILGIPEEVAEGLPHYAFSISETGAIQLLMGHLSNTLYGSTFGPNVLDGQWHHVAVTVDRDSTDGVKFYIDGQFAGSGDATLSQVNLDTAFPTFIGWEDPLGHRSHLLDEVELFKRILEPEEVALIFSADTAGKCKEAQTTLASPVNYCSANTSENGELTVCNNKSIAQTYNAKFIGLPGNNSQIGQGCNVDGPISFTPESATINVAAGMCEKLTFEIDAPANLSFADAATGCYVAQVENLSNAVCTSQTGQIKNMSTICGTPSGGRFGGGTGLVKYDEPAALSFTLTNQGPINRNIEHQIVSNSSSDPSYSQLSLDGQAPTATVSGNVTVLPGTSEEITVTASFDQFQPFNFHVVSLLADVVGDGLLEPVSTIALQATCPNNDPDGPDDDNDGVGNACDNCSSHANMGQLDTNADGFGNQCDGDYDNSGFVNSVDLGLFKNVIFTTNADVDLNGDGFVNSLDLGIFKSLFFKEPGPSAFVP